MNLKCVPFYLLILQLSASWAVVRIRRAEDAFQRNQQVTTCLVVSPFASGLATICLYNASFFPIRRWRQSHVYSKTRRWLLQFLLFDRVADATCFVQLWWLEQPQRFPRLFSCGVHCASARPYLWRRLPRSHQRVLSSVSASTNGHYGAAEHRRQSIFTCLLRHHRPRAVLYSVVERTDLGIAPWVRPFGRTAVTGR